MQFKQLTAFALLSCKFHSNSSLAFLLLAQSRKTFGHTVTFFVSAAPVTTPGHLPGRPGPVEKGSHKVSAEKRGVNDQKHSRHEVRAVRGEPDFKPHGMSLHFTLVSLTYFFSHSSGRSQESAGPTQ